ncbi:MAG: hypothetical protein Q8R92_14175 [Deltaproteobacteria bacterium]|nr:hypothetical protein [Deltaproteobacteria bacterium]
MNPYGLRDSPWASQSPTRESLDEGHQAVDPGGAELDLDAGSAGRRALEPGVFAEALLLDGDGWKLSLPAGWRVVRVGGRFDLMAPRP